MAGDTFLQLRSEMTSDGTLKLYLSDQPMPEPGPREVLVKVEAAPINPSDLGMLLGPADTSTVRAGGSAERPELIADIPERLMGMVAARLDKPMMVGNEGGGTVVATGDDPAAKALAGKVVGALGGGMYGQYRCLDVSQVLPMHDGISPKQAASCFVNPLTALGMVETMRMEGHKALVHTAAASNLGQMLNRICLADGVDLVNIVRKPEQAALLREQGAKYVCDSSDDDFAERLTDALAETEATVAFDATGGGDLGSRILGCMEAAALRNAPEFTRYGSDVYKQLYIYGGLDTSPTLLRRNFGFAFGVGGWLLTPFLGRLGAEGTERLRQRVADEITTTFASHYSDEVSLTGMLDPSALEAYNAKATGRKFLVCPHAG